MLYVTDNTLLACVCTHTHTHT